MTGREKFIPKKVKISREHAREYLREVHGVSLNPKTLEELARQRRGPKYELKGGRALYDLDDLDVYAKEYERNPIRIGRPPKEREAEKDVAA